MKKIIFLILTIFLVGCTSQQTAQKKEFDPYIGTNGIVMEFSKNAPPEKIFQKTTFPVLIKLSNVGAENIKDAYLVLSFERDYISSLKLQSNSMAQQAEDGRVIFSVDGKSRLNQQGDNNLLEFLGISGFLEQQSEQKQTSIAATMCYPYKTTLSTTVCIDPDISGISKDSKVCKVQNMEFKSGQGAPISVTRIDPIMLADIDEKRIIPQFMIFFENSGKGIPVNPKKIQNACSSGKEDGKDNELLNIAFVKVFASGDRELDCKPDDRQNDKSMEEATIKFRDKKDYIRCKFKQGEDTEYMQVLRTTPAFTSPLKIEVTYGYMDTETAVFTMIKPLGH